MWREVALTKIHVEICLQKAFITHNSSMLGIAIFTYVRYSKTYRWKASELCYHLLLILPGNVFTVFIKGNTDLLLPPTSIWIHLDSSCPVFCCSMVEGVPRRDVHTYESSRSKDNSTCLCILVWGRTLPAVNWDPAPTFFLPVQGFTVGQTASWNGASVPSPLRQELQTLFCFLN